MKAFLKQYRQSPRKVRLVADLVRGKNVERALVELDYMTQRASGVVKKLVASAVANAKNNDDRETQSLIIEEIRVDEGKTLYRSRPRSRGRSTVIRKRTSHIIVTLGEPKVEEEKEAKKTKGKKAEKKVAPKTEKKEAKDDLTKIEGIGPKIAETLTAAGIATFADLAASNVETLTEIIKDVRGNHEATTWAQQADLAANGKWDELKTLQDELDGGKVSDK